MLKNKNSVLNLLKKVFLGYCFVYTLEDIGGIIFSDPDKNTTMKFIYPLIFTIAIISFLAMSKKKETDTIGLSCPEKAIQD